jgi:excisionase family DNA binding protein
LSVARTPDTARPEEVALSIPRAFIEQVAEGVRLLLLPELQKRRNASPYVSVAEAADYLRCSRQRIYDLLSSDRLTRLRDGSRVLLSRDEIDEYLAGTSRNPVAPRLPRTSQSRSTRGIAA